MDIKERAEQFANRVIRIETQREEAVKELESLQAEFAAIDIDLLKQSNIALGKLSERQRNAAKAKLEELCTFALQYAVSPDLEAEITLTTLRNKPAAQFYVVNTKTGVRTVPIFGNGGGIVDIEGTSLRFVITEVWRDPKIDGPVFLDEAYKHLSKEYIVPIAEFLKKTSTDFGRQVIMSTHNDYIAQSADRKIQISLDDDGHSIAYCAPLQKEGALI